MKIQCPDWCRVMKGNGHFEVNQKCEPIRASLFQALQHSHHIGLCFPSLSRWKASVVFLFNAHSKDAAYKSKLIPLNKVISSLLNSSKSHLPVVEVVTKLISSFIYLRSSSRSRVTTSMVCRNNTPDSLAIRQVQVDNVVYIAGLAVVEIDHCNKAVRGRILDGVEDGWRGIFDHFFMKGFQGCSGKRVITVWYSD